MNKVIDGLIDFLTMRKMSRVAKWLSRIMFLQFFVWGAWYVSMTGFFLNFDNEATDAIKGIDVIGAAYVIGPLAAIIAPFFLGIVADRFFPTQKVLGALHLIGGIAIIAAPTVAAEFVLPDPPEGASLFYTVVLHDLPAFTEPMILLLFVHMLCYMPTLSLTTSISFEHLENQEKEFPHVRVWGTIGWIAGNLAVSLLPDKDASAGQFTMAGIAAIALAFLSFTLPNTPPPNKGKKVKIGELLGVDSLKLLKSKNYAVFMICSFLLCIPLAGYYGFARTYVESAGVLVADSATFTMSFGQMSEIFFMLIMPFMFARLGVKWMLTAGLAALVLRYGLFALGADDSIAWMIILGVVLHGICYDFFFVTGMIYVDKAAPANIRNQAQGFLVLVTQGLGLGIGAKIFAAHARANTNSFGVADWETIWLHPAIFALTVMVLFIMLFKQDKNDDPVSNDSATTDGIDQSPIGSESDPETTDEAVAG